MKAKLFIRGTKEPIELDVDEARIAEALIADTTKPKETPFSIQGVWTGKKEDMKFVTFPTKEQPKIEEDIMSIEEALEFSKEMEEFKRKAVSLGVNANNAIVLWAESKGACKTEVLKNWEGKKYLEWKDNKDNKLVNQVWNKIYAWERRMSLISFAEAKKNEELEKMAEEFIGEQKIK